MAEDITPPLFSENDLQRDEKPQFFFSPMITTKIAKRLERGDSSPLLFSFILTKSGEG
jgi:hypothetical protein